MRRYESDDNEDKFAVGKFLEGHGFTNVVYDSFMCFDKLTGKIQMLAQTLTKEQVERYKVQHPDLVIIGHDSYPMFIVEIDGSIHHTKPGMRQTERRGKSYGRGWNTVHHSRQSRLKGTQDDLAGLPCQ